MARQRLRENSTWKAAKSARKTLVEKLAKLRVAANAEMNTAEHWMAVGRYHLLNELLWECDK